MILVLDLGQPLPELSQMTLEMLPPLLFQIFCILFSILEEALVLLLLVFLVQGAEGFFQTQVMSYVQDYGQDGGKACDIQ
jgi:hypothetical protein